MGWVFVVIISGGLVLIVVVDGYIFFVVGVIIIVFVLFVISFCGFRYIFIYECYVWCIYFVVFMIIFGMVGLYVDNIMFVFSIGFNLFGSVLLLIVVVYGSFVLWVMMVFDYYVYYLVNILWLKVWFLIIVGIGIFIVIGMIVGVIVVSVFNNEDFWKMVYEGFN